MVPRSSAGKSRKSHKSRKTTPETPTPAGSPSSTALREQATPLTNPLVPILQGNAEGADAPSLPDQRDHQDQDSKKAAISTDTPTEDPQKQWWWRPTDSKARKTAEKVLVMRTAGRDDKEIAKKLKTTEATVRQYAYLARKNGWWRENEEGVEETVDVESELALNIDRKVVRNISASLDGQMTNWQTHEMTIAAAKGRGMFRNHDVVKNEGGLQLQAVQIQVIMPPVGAGDQLPQIDEAQMGGVPAYVEAEVVGDGE